jgi:exodeoxyribonuclease V beta subunit
MDNVIHTFDSSNTSLLKGINLIEASAGTGKTYAIAMLVLRFVVEQNIDIKEILVVTFTKAATNELKDRIRQRLVETRLLVQDNNSQADVTIRQWLDNLNSPPEQIIQRLNNALLDIDQAGIFTIHGFCQRMLAEHALESGQLFDFELTSDISAIKQACSDDFWRKQIYQRSAWAASLLTAQFQTPDKLLSSVNYIADDLTVFPDDADLEQKIIELKQLINLSKDDVLESLSVIQNKLAEEKFKNSFSGVFAEYSQTLMDWLNEKQTLVPDLSILTLQGLCDSLNGHKFRKSKANPYSSDEQKRHYLASIDFDPVLFEKLDSAVNSINLMLRRSLLQALREQVDKKLQQLNILSFDDLISRLATALIDEKAQGLCYQIQQRYQLALIDEFQDTDQKQWFIFSSLFSSKNHYLYLIGDPKQAIYKFRGADINSYFAAQQQAQHHFTLDKNWRSHPQLVQGINTLFAKEAPFFSSYLPFNSVKAALSSEQGALIKDKLEQMPLVLCQLDKSEKEIWSSGKAITEIRIGVVNEILDLLTDNYCIQSKEKNPVLPKDIAILVKSNKQAKDFQSALKEVGINAVVNSKESVFSSPQALELYSLLQAIAQPTNIVLVKQAIALNWFNLNGQQLFQTFNDQMAMDLWFSQFLKYQENWKKKGLMAMMQGLLTEEKVFLNLSNHVQAERNITNLQHCIELVQQVVIDDHLGINKTLDWLKSNIAKAELTSISTDDQQLRLESDDDAIKIITMHSAKGLEYPVVFCPFLWQRGNALTKERQVIKCHTNGKMIADLGSKKFEQHRLIALEEELAEDLRIFYVAVTRAKYRCYIYWADVRTKDKANDSAMAYLLDFSTDDFLKQQQKLQCYSTQQALVFEYRLLNTGQQVNRRYQPQQTKKKFAYKQKKRSSYSDWQMSSYTALSSLSITDVPELPEDKAREELVFIPEELNSSELPRGVHTGNVIHDLLENIPFYYLAENNDISLQRDKACLRYGLKTDTPEQIDQLLRNAVNTELSAHETSFSLRQLNEQTCLKEMPFYLSMNTLDTEQINQILEDCPTFQALSKKAMRGFLTGFIDLICQYNGQYYLMDYKSNYLQSYDDESLVLTMREHNYGLQYWIYTVVLHKYLQNRLPGYNYEQHFGGVKYLFVRGMSQKAKNSGVYQIKPELAKIEQLVRLFN